MFGFVLDAYVINENERWVVFSVSLISGTFTGEVSIEFFTEDGSGLGQSLVCMLDLLHKKVCT